MFRFLKYTDKEIFFFISCDEDEPIFVFCYNFLENEIKIVSLFAEEKMNLGRILRMREYDENKYLAVTTKYQIIKLEFKEIIT